MFTGIVEEVGSVISCENFGLTVKGDMVMPGLRLGDSMAVNGTCLTVVELDADRFRVDLAPETLAPHLPWRVGARQPGQPGTAAGGQRSSGRPYSAGPR